jgi:hypothetical protein
MLHSFTLICLKDKAHELLIFPPWLHQIVGNSEWRTWDSI